MGHAAVWEWSLAQPGSLSKWITHEVFEHGHEEPNGPRLVEMNRKKSTWYFSRQWEE